ncbi:MAG TPA: TolC family protein [Fluviicoccus sp.]|nr:TolC family protein [Fluviicoccus sp.]
MKLLQGAIRSLWLAGLSLSVHAADLSFAQAMHQAAAQASSLRQRQADVAGASSAVVAADALPDPKVFAGIDNLPVQGADRFALTRDFMTMQKIGVMQEIPNGSKREARAESAKARVAQAEAALRLAEVTVNTETATAWLNRYYLQQQRARLAELEQENRLWLGVVQSQLTSGKVSAADALLPRQEALTLATRRDALERDIRRADAMLVRWIGDTGGPVTPVGEPPDFKVDAEHLRAHVHHHPALGVYEPLSGLAQAELHEAQATLKPDWAVEVGWQHRGPDFGDMVSFQVSADLPLFSRTRQTPLIEARRQALASLDAEREDMQRDHAATLESELADHDALSRELARLQQQALPLAEQRVELQRAAYEAGRADPGLVLAARRDLRELQLQILELTRQQQTLAARLHYLYDFEEDAAP